MIFKIELTAEDIELIGRLLDEQPYKLVAPLAQRVQAQINAQQLPDVIDCGRVPGLGLSRSESILKP